VTLQFVSTKADQTRLLGIGLSFANLDLAQPIIEGALHKARLETLIFAIRKATSALRVIDK
jgi:hypothetical protein